MYCFPAVFYSRARLPAVKSTPVSRMITMHEFVVLFQLTCQAVEHKGHEPCPIHLISRAVIAAVVTLRVHGADSRVTSQSVASKPVELVESLSLVSKNGMMVRYDWRENVNPGSATPLERHQLQVACRTQMQETCHGRVRPAKMTLCVAISIACALVLLVLRWRDGR